LELEIGNLNSALGNALLADWLLAIAYVKTIRASLDTLHALDVGFQD
jgi:hypothetical protein